MRTEKQLLKNEVSDKIKLHGSFVIMQYAGLNANAASSFRREIGKMGGEVEIVRKRILEKVAQDMGLTFDSPTLEGHIGLVFLGQDPIETTKTVFKFSQDNNKVIQVNAARLDGTMYVGADVERLSKLPNKNEMRAQLLSIFEAPMSQTLAVMDAVLTSVPHCLENKCKLEAEEGTQGESEDEGKSEG
jgi:large subunit ribosomal protein L10